MEWRDVIGPWDDGQNVFGALLDMPPADRIALARELLAGTGRVVAMEVCVGDDPHDNAAERRWARGWNACRAAMMESDT